LAISLTALAAPTLPQTAAQVEGGTGSVALRIDGLRSLRGDVLICLTREKRYFPKCDRDPAALRAVVPARKNGGISFDHIPGGDYAALVLHDENGNRRMDMMLGIPREGVGFSRNPRLFMGPPSYASVRFPVSGAKVEQIVHMRYFL
jgi:uncharacterized protein (DUF2141 family)